MDKITLDKYQKKVIKTKAKNTLVIAGAGSGKTLTIIHKIKNLIKIGINPNEILCITFTKSAAKNLENKLLKENIYLKVNTFHSLGFQIIKHTQNVQLVQEHLLENIIMKHLNSYQHLEILIQPHFIEFGTGNSKVIKNAIIKNTHYINNLKDIIKTFITLFKSNNYLISSFDEFHQKNQKENSAKKKTRHRLFLKLVKKIYVDYEAYLEDTNQIDFNDMINKATQIIKEEGIYPYKYIIIDEYQDTSLNKCILVKMIQNKTDASLLAVGDDWQSIYRFTGSNLDIFTNFKRFFPKSKIIKLKKTYRNSREIIKVAKKFIMKNPYQINKKLLSTKETKTPIHIYFYKKNIKSVWDKISKQIDENTYVLGRNNSDINKIPYLNKHMKYMTIHKSKGLEADKIILINLENSITGFPSKVKNSEYLKYVLPKEDDYIFAEERRLFYVAITRTKSLVILLVNQENPSIFITELLKDSRKYIKVFK